MPYTGTTFANYKNQLAAQLGDTGKVHFTDTELGIFIQEALRTWNSIALYWRGEYTFALTANQPIISIEAISDISAMPGLNNFTLTDRNVVNSIQLSLYEPVTTNWSLLTPSMTDMFTVADLQNAIEKRRNQFLEETGIVSTTYTLSNPSTIQELNENLIDIRRMTWNTGTSRSLIYKTDEFALNCYKPSWRSSGVGIPKTYAQGTTNLLQVRFDPAPPSGTLEYQAISAGASLDVSTGVIIGIPDDLMWVVRFGALGDLLLRDGQAKDASRAEYCMSRWKEGIEVARRLFTTIEQARIGTQEIMIGAIQSMDCYKPGWDNARGEPLRMGTISPNMFGLWPVPDSNYGLTLTVVRNAQVPVLDNDAIQVGREIRAAIINYAEHLCLFKEEGPEFFNSMTAYKDLFELAKVNNQRLRAQAEYFDVLNDRGMLNEKYKIRRKEVAA